MPPPPGHLREFLRVISTPILPALEAKDQPKPRTEGPCGGSKPQQEQPAFLTASRPILPSAPSRAHRRSASLWVPHLSLYHFTGEAFPQDPCVPHPVSKRTILCCPLRCLGYSKDGLTTEIAQVGYIITAIADWKRLTQQLLERVTLSTASPHVRNSDFKNTSHTAVFTRL